VKYGQVIKDKEEQKVIGLHKRKVFGNISYSDIRINKVDGFCSKLRARIGCFVRKTRNFSKKRKQIIDLLYIFQINHNFIEAKNKITPAMKEGLIYKPLSWNDIFNMKLSINI
jgi:hypothetical protein